jgi:hypothetical protein
MAGLLLEATRKNEKGLLLKWPWGATDVCTFRVLDHRRPCLGQCSHRLCEEASELRRRVCSGRGTSRPGPVSIYGGRPEASTRVRELGRWGKMLF